MNYESVALQLPGLKVAGLAWGPADGRPILALHGWLDNAASFERLGPLLTGARVVALDLPGHGHSEHRPEGVAYHFIDWVVDVAAAADALGWEQFTLLSHSMGAGIASLLAGTLPERITQLILIEGLGPLSVSAEEAPLRLAKSILRRGVRSRRPARTHADRAAAAARLVQVNPTLSAVAAEVLVARGTEAVEGGVTWRADPRLRGLSPLRITEEHVHAYLRRIACPTLLVRAREGYAFDQKLFASRVACLRDMQIVELSGGHHLHLDTPEAVAEHVNAFLAKATSSTDTGSDEARLTPQGMTLNDLTILGKLKAVVLDVDGVLTTGLMPWSEGGNDQLAFDVKDGLGLKLLMKGGFHVALLSGRDVPAVRARGKTLGIEHLHLGIKDKVPELQRLLTRLEVKPEEVAYMGDDLPDLGVLRFVGYPTAPADARPEIRAVAKFVTGSPGGRGAVRELAEHLLKAQGRWMSLLTGL